ncbi:hypothetical protein THASP1DRAFT_27354 [Thamnocephalis sphaerospora]|uniref:Calcium-dependent phosphotriesterase n=1 Tax=Thamnocephalis sphaerospora TaxID=78915 RepID=A0A4V1IXF4_9FUNG|nr:hypothetical protein THASP1DRAFT_27354 [Thamnocephalis sphaerospora]|eukprot:RKP10869.1 hypothetical protein THASP1DRAFT_27354 [Thamnocephalis sphaerospora]
MASDKSKAKSAAKKNSSKAAKSGGGNVLLVALAIALIPVLAFVVPEAGRLYHLTGLSHTPTLTEQTCKHVTADRLEGCEDLAIHHRSGRVFLSCGSVATGKLDELKIAGLETVGLRSQGLGIWDPVVDDRSKKTSAAGDSDAIVIMVVNHRSNESVIEIIEHQPGTTEAVLVETARHPLIQAPNGVLPVSARSFYVSNDLYNTDSKGRMFEMLTAREWGGVVFRSEDGEAVQAANGIGFANGLGTNYNRDLIYVASSYKKVLVYERRVDNVLSLRDQIDVPVLADNLRVNPVDGSILVAGNTRFLEFLKAMTDPTARAHVEVVRIANNTGSDAYYGVKYTQKTIFGDYSLESTPLSTADYSPQYNKLVLSTIVNPGFLVCDKTL